MNAEELKKRSKTFSLRVLRLVGALPNSVQGRAIGSQLIRWEHPSGQIIAPLVEPVQKLNSSRRLGLLKEADESAFWMELIIESGMLREKVVGALLLEAKELVAIMASSRISAAKSLKRRQ